MVKRNPRENKYRCKLRCIKSLPENAILVTLDVISLYTNIDHTEGAVSCYNKLESRDDFETKMLDEYEKKTKIRPLIWWRYIDDISFIWHDDEKSL